MSAGPSAFLANNLLDAYLNNDSFVIAAPYVKLHIGDPGAAGTANPAVNTTRKVASFGVASGGQCLNDVAITWTAVAATEAYTYFSVWDTVGPAGGNFLHSGTVTANPVTAGDTFTVPIGVLSLNIVNVAA